MSTTSKKNIIILIVISLNVLFIFMPFLLNYKHKEIIKWIQISVLIFVFMLLVGSIYYREKKQVEVNYKGAFFVTIFGVLAFVIGGMIYRIALK